MAECIGCGMDVNGVACVRCQDNVRLCTGCNELAFNPSPVLLPNGEEGHACDECLEHPHFIDQVDLDTEEGEEFMADLCSIMDTLKACNNGLPEL